MLIGWNSFSQRGGCLENEDLRPKTQNEDPLKNEDLENEDPSKTKTYKTKTP